ncbi:MAG: hypothetical protein MK208_15220 [Shimia sp.]|uniref:hypothetical protein n=1 Tax=Shimia sp. TaxID=1954381 RepID=UPI0025D53D87|nr:hypothetical protein [Shimia sp.]MCH2068585.1 hypothetical protein [Shimia sp.]
MKPKLYIHIGFPKCGSTTLQNFLVQAQGKLRNHGMVVVDQNMNHPGNTRAKRVAQYSLWKMLDSPGAPKEIAESLTKIAIAMKKHNTKAAVFSGEQLGNQAEYAEFFRPALALFDVKVIAYVRPQETWLPSAWKQFGVREGKSLETHLDSAPRARVPGFLRKLKAWGSVFGKENIYVNTLARGNLYQSDLIADFCKALDLPDSFAPNNRPKNSTNVTFDNHILMVLLSAPKLLEGGGTGSIYGFLDKYLPKPAFESGRNAVSHEKALQIREEFREENEAIVAEFMPGSTYQEAFETQKPLKPMDVSSDLLTANAKTTAYLIAIAEKQSREIETLRKQLKRLEAKLED